MADHANNLASKIRSNLTNSMKALDVDILTGVGTILVSIYALVYPKITYTDTFICYTLNNWFSNLMLNDISG